MLHSPRFSRPAVWTTVAVLSITSCSDDTAGPRAPLAGRLAVAPDFGVLQTDVVPIARGRFLLTRIPSGAVAKDTVIDIAPDADSVSLTLPVQVLIPGETFDLTISLLNAAGDTVFRGGPLPVSPATSGTPTPVDVPFTYVGTGADAAGVRILTPDTTTFAGEFVLLAGEAFDAGAAAIPGTPIGWTSLDTARVRVATDPQYRGVAVGGSQRGVARLVATLVTGQRDTILVYNQPLPSAIVAETGTGQSALADSALPQPLGVRVTAGDGQGTYGVWVRFGVSANGGPLSADSVRTDSAGRVAVTYTMARSFQPQVITATTTRLGGQQATFTPTLLFAPPASLEIVAGDGQTGEVGSALAVPPQVRVRDAQGLGIPGLTVTFAPVTGGGSVTDGTPVTDTLGLAAVTDWILGTVAGANTLHATVDTFVVTFTATGLAGPADRVAFTAEPTAVQQDSAIAPPVVVTAYDALGNVASGFAGPVQLTLLANPGGATLGGTTSTAAVGGVASFADLRLDAPGVGYTLLASSSGLTPDTSAAFEVLAPVRQIRWINAAGGDWETAANWDQGRVPTVDDSVVIDLAGSYTVGVTSTAPVAANLRIGGAGSTPTLRIGAAPHTALTVADGLVNAGTILLTNDGLNAAASLTVTAGTLLNTGLIEATAGAGGVGGRSVTAAVNNQGTISATSFGLSVVNAARTFTSTSGTLATPSGHTLAISGGTVQFGSGTALAGSGVFALSATTRLELPSDFTLAPGDYRIDLAGGDGIRVIGPGTLTVGDTLVLTADTIDAPLLVQGRVEARATGSVINGALAIDPSGLLRVGDVSSSALTVASGFTNAGTVLLTNDGLNAASSLGVLTGTLLNTGRIEATAGAGGAGARAITANVDNEGTVSATSFNLTFINTGRLFRSTSGTLTTPNGNTLAIAGGTVEFGAATVLAGRGVFSIPANTVLDLPSDFTLAAGDYRLDLGGVNGIVVNGPGRLFAHDTLTLTGDTINAPLTVTGRVEVRGTTSLVNGALGVGPGALLRIGDVGHSALVVADGFVNDGTILLTNDGLNAGASLTVLAGTLVNDALIEATAGAGGAGGRTLGGAVLNAGTISATSFNFTVDNTGRTFTTTGGTLATPNGHTLTLSGGTVEFGSGTVLTGTGVVSLPAATLLALPGDFTLAAGDYRLDLAGSGGISVNGPGTFTVGDTLVLTADTVNAPLTIAGRVEGRGTTSLINGALAITPAGVLRIGDPGNSAVTVASGFTNAGTILLTNEGVNASASLAVGAGTLVNTGTIASAPAFGGGPATMTLATALDHRGAITLDYPIAGLGQLTVPPTADASVTGNGTALSVAGLDVDGVTFDNAPLVSTGGTITRFDNVTFQNMSAAAIQLTVNHPGGPTPYVFTGVAFLTTPATGKYIRASDQTVGDDGLVIEMVDATPVDGSAYEEELNGAVINWVVPAVLQVVFAGDSVYGVGPSTGVFTVNPDGTNRARPASTTPFTGSPRYHPRWSPDRTRIAYGHEPVGANGNWLYVMSADGTESAAVVTDTNTALARWSPDGVHLAFVCDGYTPQFTYLEDVCVISDVTGSVPSLAGAGDGTGKVFVSQLVGSASRRSGPSAFAWNPANPDQLAFVRDSTDATSGIRSSRIYIATYSAGAWTVQPLSANVMDAGAGPVTVASAWLDWSGAGRIVFAAYDQSFQLDIYVINDDGSGLSQLTASAAYDDDPLWSPSGGEILFNRDDSCNLDAWLMNADGSGQRQVTAEGVCDFDTSILGYDWSPNGQEIVLTGFDSPYSNVLIYRILRTTTAATYFTDRILIGRGAAGPGEVRDIQPSWRP